MYLTGLHISQIIGHMIPDYSNNTVPWEYKEVPTKDLRVVFNFSLFTPNRATL